MSTSASTILHNHPDCCMCLGEGAGVLRLCSLGHASCHACLIAQVRTCLASSVCRVVCCPQCAPGSIDAVEGTYPSRWILAATVESVAAVQGDECSQVGAASALPAPGLLLAAEVGQYHTRLLASVLASGATGMALVECVACSRAFEAAASGVVQRVACPHGCGASLCQACGLPWAASANATTHAGLSCPDFAVRRLVSGSDGGTLQCPGCDTALAKAYDHGCHHVTCGVCSYQVCWTCKTPYAPSGGRVKAQCSCPLLCSPSCKCAPCDACPTRQCQACSGRCPQCRARKGEAVSVWGGSSSYGGGGCAWGGQGGGYGYGEGTAQAARALEAARQRAYEALQQACAAMPGGGAAASGGGAAQAPQPPRQPLQPLLAFRARLGALGVPADGLDRVAPPTPAAAAAATAAAATLSAAVLAQYAAAEAASLLPASAATAAAAPAGAAESEAAMDSLPHLALLLLCLRQAPAVLPGLAAACHPPPPTLLLHLCHAIAAWDASIQPEGCNALCQRAALRCAELRAALYTGLALLPPSQGFSRELEAAVLQLVSRDACAGAGLCTGLQLAEALTSAAAARAAATARPGLCAAAGYLLPIWPWLAQRTSCPLSQAAAAVLQRSAAAALWRVLLPLPPPGQQPGHPGLQQQLAQLQHQQLLHTLLTHTPHWPPPVGQQQQQQALGEEHATDSAACAALAAPPLLRPLHTLVPGLSEGAVWFEWPEEGGSSSAQGRGEALPVLRRLLQLLAACRPAGTPPPTLLQLALRHGLGLLPPGSAGVHLARTAAFAPHALAAAPAAEQWLQAAQAHIAASGLAPQLPLPESLRVQAQLPGELPSALLVQGRCTWQVLGLAAMAQQAGRGGSADFASLGWLQWAAACREVGEAAGPPCNEALLLQRTLPLLPEFMRAWLQDEVEVAALLASSSSEAATASAFASTSTSASASATASASALPPSQLRHLYAQCRSGLLPSASSAARLCEGLLRALLLAPGGQAHAQAAALHELTHPPPCTAAGQPVLPVQADWPAFTLAVRILAEGGGGGEGGWQCEGVRLGHSALAAGLLGTLVEAVLLRGGGAAVVEETGMLLALLEAVVTQPAIVEGAERGAGGLLPRRLLAWVREADWQQGKASLARLRELLGVQREEVTWEEEEEEEVPYEDEE